MKACLTTANLGGCKHHQEQHATAGTHTEPSASLSFVLDVEAGSKKGTTDCQMGMHKLTQRKKFDSQMSENSPNCTENVQVSLQYNENLLVQLGGRTSHNE